MGFDPGSPGSHSGPKAGAKPLCHPGILLFLKVVVGQPWWLSSLASPSAQGVILETRDRVPCQAPGAWSLLLPLPVSLPLSLSVCDYHK